MYYKCSVCGEHVSDASGSWHGTGKCKYCKEYSYDSSHIIAQFNGVRWFRRPTGFYVVVYGQQVTQFYCDIAASEDFGHCVRHSLECAGLLD